MVASSEAVLGGGGIGTGGIGFGIAAAISSAVEVFGISNLGGGGGAGNSIGLGGLIF